MVMTTDRLSNMSLLINDLNTNQLLAVEHEGSPLLVVAGAGSGKTRVLTRRIAYLLAERNIAPFEILAITFTNKAAGEMKDRVLELVGDRAKSMWVSTFHSACVRILRKEASLLGYTNSFTIYDQSDSLRLITVVMREMNIDEKRYAPRAIASLISQAKNELLGPIDFSKQANDHFKEIVAEVFNIYQKRLVNANSMDFDDLISKTVEILRLFPETKAKYRSRFRHILVDEYQDTNHAQYALIKELVGSDKEGFPPAELCVVGDADQSIYAFRGANIRNILQFEADYPTAKTILLEQNYRSTQNILTAANSVISNNEGRKEKNLWSEAGSGSLINGYVAESEHDEANFVVSQISRLRELNQSMPGDTAIFYRTNAQSRVFEEVFMRAGIPYKVVGGVRFYERKEIKDFLAYLRVIVNPNDEISMKRIINTPKRGIGDRSIAQIESFARSNNLSFWQSLCEVDKNKEITAKSQLVLREFVQLIKSLQTLVDAKTLPSVIAQAVLEQTGMLKELKESKDPQDEVRLENLEELVAVATEYEEGEFSDDEEISLSGFLEGVSLVADADQIPDGEDHGGLVTLMTLHTAKGLEFKTVFLTGMEEGIFPHSRTLDDPEELQEERRLAYVGLTRARENLFITRAEYRSAWGAPNYNLASRFITEIPAKVIEWNQAQERSTKLRNSIRRNFTAPKATGKTSTTMILNAGDRVSHDTFGLGTVKEVNGEGDRAEATIDFGSFGDKRLLLRYAPVVKL
jgi:DNA helicase-2/ATP-dependent DNA helicase PcrA